MSILILGGYGVVGTQVARLLRRRQPKLELLIAGRDAGKAAALAAELGHARGLALDAGDPAALDGVGEALEAVVLTVNDGHDAVLRAALRRGLGLVDITRWTARVQDAEALLAQEPPQAPVILGSSWMASLPAALAHQAAAAFDAVESIDLSVLYALRDRSGVDSIAYMDRLAQPFPVIRAGRKQLVRPFSDGRRVRFTDGRQFRVYRFDTPDQLTLPRLTGAQTVAARIAFDSVSATLALRLLVGSGLWSLISGPRFRRLRHALLHQPGPGAPHQVCIDLVGRQAGAPLRRRIQLQDPLGQTHLTAVGAVLQVECLLQEQAPPAGLHYGEALLAKHPLHAALAAEGVTVNVSDANVT